MNMIAPPPTVGGLTPRQAQVLAAIREHIARHGHAPSYIEIAQAVGLRSKNSVARHLYALSMRGFIRLDRYSQRSIRVLTPTPDPVADAARRLLASISGESERDEHGRVTITVDADALGDVDIALAEVGHG